MGSAITPTENESRLQRFSRSLREVGPLYTAQNVVKTIFPEGLLRANTAFIVETDMRDWRVDPAPGFDMRWADESDTELFEQAGVSAAEFRGHLERGAHVAISVRDGGLAGYRIQETGGIDYYGWLRYRLARDVIWTTMAWTAPRLRGQGLHSHMQHFSLGELARRGYVRKLASVDASNIASLRATLKSSTVVGSVSFVGSLGLTAVWVNGRRQVGSWNEANRLELGSDLFRAAPNRPFGSLDRGRLERLVGKRD